MLEVYSAYFTNFVHMLTQLERMPDSQQGSVKAVQHQTELNQTGSLPIHSDPYQAGPDARELEKQETDWMIGMDDI